MKKVILALTCILLIIFVISCDGMSISNKRYYEISSYVLARQQSFSGDNFGSRYEDDGGVYFGKPNDGTDWCFIKKITSNWYYYELHWG